MRARRAFAAAWLGLAALAPLGSRAQEPPEPSGYRTDRYRSPTPATLNGAKVLPVGEAETLWKAGTAVFIDVLPNPPKPAQLPPGTPWRDSPRHSVPGALWLPNVGFGEISPETESYFRRGLEAATKGDLGKPIVLFCQRECWMSWNAAKRALAFGYRRVFWFPDGSDGWSEAGLPLERVEPYAEPKE